jgi:hypothetical protein
MPRKISEKSLAIPHIKLEVFLCCGPLRFGRFLCPCLCHFVACAQKPGRLGSGHTLPVEEFFRTAIRLQLAILSIPGLHLRNDGCSRTRTSYRLWPVSLWPTQVGVRGCGRRIRAALRVAARCSTAALLAPSSPSPPLPAPASLRLPRKLPVTRNANHSHNHSAFMMPQATLIAGLPFPFFTPCHTAQYWCIIFNLQVAAASLLHKIFT